VLCLRDLRMVQAGITPWQPGRDPKPRRRLMCENDHPIGRRSLLSGLAATAAAATVTAGAAGEAAAQNNRYADPPNPKLPKSNSELDLARTALVVIDPQVDVLSPKGRLWTVVGESVTEQNLVPNLVRLFDAAKRAGITVAISPHYYYPQDYRWGFAAPVELL